MSGRAKSAARPGPYRLVPGAPVYDAAGELVGTVDAATLEHEYLIVRQSTTFPHDLYLPPQAIARVEPDGVYLKPSRRVLRGKRYAAPPEAAAGATTARAAGAATAEQRDQVMPERSASTARATAATEPVSTISVPLAAEELVARRTPVRAGTVRLRKGVETAEQVVDVPVTRDEVIVEHIPPDQFDANATLGADELLIPIMEEQVVVQKRLVVKEYVRVRKRQVVEQRQVRAPVRREVLSVQEQRAPGAEQGQPEWPLVREMRAPMAEETPDTDAGAAP